MKAIKRSLHRVLTHILLYLLKLELLYTENHIKNVGMLNLAKFILAKFYTYGMLNLIPYLLSSHSGDAS